MPAVRVTNSGDGQQWGIMLEMSRRGRRDTGERGHPGGPCMRYVSLPMYQFLKEKYGDHRAGWKYFNRTLLFLPSEIANLLNASCFSQADFKDAVTNLRQVMGPSSPPSSEAGRPKTSHMGSLLGLFLWQGGDSTENAIH